MRQGVGQGGSINISDHCQRVKCFDTVFLSVMLNGRSMDLKTVRGSNLLDGVYVKIKRRNYWKERDIIVSSPMLGHCFDHQTNSFCTQLLNQKYLVACHPPSLRCRCHQAHLQFFPTSCHQQWQGFLGERVSGSLCHFGDFGSRQAAGGLSVARHIVAQLEIGTTTSPSRCCSHHFPHTHTDCFVLAICTAKSCHSARMAKSIHLPFSCLGKETISQQFFFGEKTLWKEGGCRLTFPCNFSHLLLPFPNVKILAQLCTLFYILLCFYNTR